MRVYTTFGILIGVALSAPPVMAQTLDLPSPQEAARAYVKATNSMGMSWGEKKESDYVVTLGECTESTSGPGVICIASIKTKVADAKAFHNKIGFSKGPTGEWVATFER